jgi:hypothetical protein
MAIKFDDDARKRVTEEMISAGMEAFAEYSVTDIYNGDVTDREIILAILTAAARASSVPEDTIEGGSSTH